jgi:P-type E1-E2 ATPase
MAGSRGVIELEIPGWKSLHLGALVLDVNGVLAVDGRLLPKVRNRIAGLRSRLEVHLLSADTYGGLERISRALGVAATRLAPGGDEVEQKARFVRGLGSGVVAVGNGANDVGMLREASLGIAVLGQEGLAAPTLEACDVLVGSVQEALDLLIRPTRLVATLRR